MTNNRTGLQARAAKRREFRLSTCGAVVLGFFASAAIVGCTAEVGPGQPAQISPEIQKSIGGGSGVRPQKYDEPGYHLCFHNCMAGMPDAMSGFCACACSCASGGVCCDE